MTNVVYLNVNNDRTNLDNVKEALRSVYKQYLQNVTIGTVTALVRYDGGYYNTCIFIKCGQIVFVTEFSYDPGLIRYWQIDTDTLNLYYIWVNK